MASEKQTQYRYNSTTTVLKDRAFISRTAGAFGRPGFDRLGKVIGFVGPNHVLVDYYNGGKGSEQRVVAVTDLVTWMFFDTWQEAAETFAEFERFMAASKPDVAPSTDCNPTCRSLHPDAVDEAGGDGGAK